MLKWKAFIGDINSKFIEEFNIFDHPGFRKACSEAAKTFAEEGDEKRFAETVEKELLYYFWKKCEWETVISHWPPHDTLRSKKVDVYEQVMMNSDIFFDYMIRNYKELL